MEARLQTVPRGVLPVLMVLALVLALLIGTALGYLVKASSTTVGPTRYVVLPVDQVSADPTGCTFLSGHKAC